MKQVTFKFAFKNSCSVSSSRRSAGRDFHTDGLATEEARSVVYTTISFERLTG